MFLRRHQRFKDGKEHSYWSLVETVRTADGPRQRTLCYLGELNGSAQSRWLKTIEVFNEKGECRQLKHLLKARGLELSPVRALALLSTIQSADIVLPTTDGREIRLRRVTRPEPAQKQLLNQLKITLPERLNFNPNVVQTLQSA